MFFENLAKLHPIFVGEPELRCDNIAAIHYRYKALLKVELRLVPSVIKMNRLS